MTILYFKIVYKNVELLIIFKSNRSVIIDYTGLVERTVCSVCTCRSPVLQSSTLRKCISDFELHRNSSRRGNSMATSSMSSKSFTIGRYLCVGVVNFIVTSSPYVLPATTLYHRVK